MRRSALALLLGCLLLVAGASALDGYDYYQTIEYAACDQEIYQQDIVIHRSTGTAYNETAGGLETWHIFVGDHCQADYDDVRFTNSTGAELAYYLWPDYDATSARIAVRLEGADAAGEVTVWYGSAAATTTSDGDGTYTFFDQFPGATIDATKWTIGGGSYSLSGGVLSFSGTSHAYTHTSFSPGSILECRARMDNAEYSYVGYRSPLCRWFGWYAPEYPQLQLFGPASRTNFGASDEQYHLFRIDRPSSNSQIGYIDGVQKASHSDSFGESATLIVGGNGGAASVWRLDWILVRTYSATPPAAITFSGEQETAAPPVTTFTASPTAGLAPLTVQFTDTSAGSPTSWAWTFGDGGTSSEQNPQHTYTTPGAYSVNLTATNEYGSDYELKPDYITVYSPITAQFTANITGGTAPLAVQFTDRSTGSPTSWSWTFGDDNTSTDQNPAHTYTTAGTHTVTLTASHPYDSDTETKAAYITVAVLQPFPGLPLIPRDLTGNGLYTDINGNGRSDYNDLTIFFQHLAWAKTAQPTSCFDFNGNGWLDYNDVITLFATITEEHL